MRVVRFFASQASKLLIVCIAAYLACLGFSRAVHQPVALLLGDDQRLTYLDLDRHGSFTTRQSITLGPQHTMMVSPDGRYVFNQNAPYTLYDTYDGQLVVAPIPNVCVKFQLSDRFIGCIDVQSLRVVDLSGGENAHALADERLIDYHWTANGAGLVFTEWHDQQTDLLVADSPSAKPRKVASVAGQLTFDSLSPDGRYALCLDNSPNHRSLVLVDLTDGSYRVVDYDSDADNKRINALIWSPDAQNVVVMMAADKVTALADPVPSAILNMANGTVLPLSDDTGDVSWSPDGRRLLYIALHRFDVNGLLRDLLVVQADGSHEVRVAHNPTGSYFWSLNGDQMYAIRQGKIYTLPMTGGLPIPTSNWPISTTVVPTIKFFWR